MKQPADHCAKNYFLAAIEPDRGDRGRGRGGEDQGAGPQADADLWEAMNQKGADQHRDGDLHIERSTEAGDQEIDAASRADADNCADDTADH